MKRLIIITFITLFISANSQAQRNRVHKTSYPAGEYKSELREIQKFDRQSDTFSYALMTGDRWSARKNKAKILRTMEAEIWDTRQKLNEISYYGNKYSKRSGNEYYRGRKGGVYSKQNGRKVSRYEQQLLINKLEKQIRIKNRFENTELIGNRRGRIINEREHRKLMYRFRDTMIEGLENERGQRQRRG